jgi:hypothetical protein
VRKAPRDPIRDAIAALDLVGAIDELQKAFCRSGLLTPDTLREATWLQHHLDADRKLALTKLKKALTPIPFARLPEGLRWIHGHAIAPCYVPAQELEALRDLIGPNVFGEEG